MNRPPTDPELQSLLERLEHEPADALESQWLDFKPWTEPKADLRTACEYAACFANAEGGVLVFGVADETAGRAQAMHGARRFDVDVFRRGFYEGKHPALSASASASVEASRLLARWSGPDGFLDKLPPENLPRYMRRSAGTGAKRGV